MMINNNDITKIIKYFNDHLENNMDTGTSYASIKYKLDSELQKEFYNRLPEKFRSVISKIFNEISNILTRENGYLCGPALQEITERGISPNHCIFGTIVLPIVDIDNIKQSLNIIKDNGLIILEFKVHYASRATLIQVRYEY